MAGPDTKLSQKTEITDPSGGYLHMIVFSGGSWKSYRLPTSVLSQIPLLQVIKEVNRSADFTQAFDASAKLFSIDFQQLSGAPKIKVGLTSGGTEISLSEIPIPSGNTTSIPFNQTFDIASTVYITITGGTVNVNFTYSENFF